MGLLHACCERFGDVIGIAFALLIAMTEADYVQVDGHAHNNGTHTTVTIDRNTILTVSITVPSAVLVGALWCWCMTKACRTDRPAGEKPRIHSVTTLNREYDLEANR